MKSYILPFSKRYRYLLVFIFVVIGGWYWVTRLVSIDAVRNIPQASIIYDRNGVELYRFFEQDRKWVEYDQISLSMKQAIIAAEDKTFWTNNGTDVSSLGRAILNNIQQFFQKSGGLQGGSTITQQLIKNVFLTNQKTIKRKLQEIILAQHLTATRADETGFKRAKEEILSAYLNVVYYGNHSYGIQSAAQRYFATDALSLTLLQSSILASLPQAPSLYNPTSNPEPVLGYRNIYTESEIRHGLLYMSGTDRIDTHLQSTPFIIKNICLDDLTQRATLQSGEYLASYQIGRKDRVLCRMYELKMIQAKDIQQAFLESKHLSFPKTTFPIKAPHFVFWLQRYLLGLKEFSGYDEQQLARAGLHITTTLDRTKQQQAEDSIMNYMGSLRRLGGNNRAMLHIDPKDGAVLSYVGSADFFDTEILGKNDMIQSKRQLGSTLKPFFYSYLFAHYPVAIDGAVVDAPIKGQNINNHDRMFRGKITFAEALASSRNLPIVRIYMALGGDRIFVPYLQQLGFQLSGVYNYPLALGANDASMLQLGQAYMQLAHSDSANKVPMIHPILTIRDAKKQNLYTSKNHIYTAKIIPETVADMVWNILSNKEYMPSDWYRLRNIPLTHFALKTGTTDKKIGKKLYPRDGRSVIYNADNLLLTRAGNTNGKEMGSKAFGGEINHHVIRQYTQAIKDSGTLLDAPKSPGNSVYTSGNSYADVDHKDLDEGIQQALWRFDGVIESGTGEESGLNDGGEGSGKRIFVE